MSMELNWNRHCLLKLADKLKTHIGGQQASHILNTDTVGTGIFNLPRLIDPCVNSMHRAYRVGDGTLGMFTHLLYCAQCCLQIAHIIHRIEHPEYINAIDRSALNKLLYHIVRIMAVTKNILPAEQHLLGSIRHRLFNFTDPIPGVFAQKANAGVKGSPAPGFHRPVAYLIKFLSNGQHIVDTHTGRKQRLMSIAKNNFGYTKRRGFRGHSYVRLSKVCG